MRLCCEFLSYCNPGEDTPAAWSSVPEYAGRSLVCAPGPSSPAQRDTTQRSRFASCITIMFKDAFLPLRPWLVTELDLPQSRRFGISNSLPAGQGD